jgi:hypothetical protein
MERMIKVTFQDKIVKEFSSDVSLLEISHAFRNYFNYPVMIAKVDNNLAHLGKTITKKCNVDFYDRSSIVGNSVYASSVQLMLVVAIKRVLGKDVDVMIEHSIDRGIYCELINRNITKEELSQIDKMYLKFGEKLESEFLSQSEFEDRTIEQTLDLGWKVLSLLPKSELYRIKPEYIEKYMPKE